MRERPVKKPLSPAYEELTKRLGLLENKLCQTDTDIPMGRGETILVVDDDPMILKLNQKILEKLGYRVMTALLPKDAIALANEHANTIHLLLTDVIMPEMNGLDLSKRLQGIAPDIEILFMSGYTADVIDHQGVLSEGVNFIQKPFTRMALAAKIRAIIDKCRKCIPTNKSQFGYSPGFNSGDWEGSQSSK